MKARSPAPAVRVDLRGMRVYQLPQVWQLVVSGSLNVPFSGQAGKRLRVKCWQSRLPNRA